MKDISSGRRGGLRSHSGPGGRTKAQLYNEAKDRGIEGRSTMDKAQLERALARKDSNKKERPDDPTAPGARTTTTAA